MNYTNSNKYKRVLIQQINVMYMNKMYSKVYRPTKKIKTFVFYFIG